MATAPMSSEKSRLSFAKVSELFDIASILGCYTRALLQFCLLPAFHVKLTVYAPGCRVRR